MPSSPLEWIVVMHSIWDSAKSFSWYKIYRQLCALLTLWVVLVASMLPILIQGAGNDQTYMTWDWVIWSTASPQLHQEEWEERNDTGPVYERVSSGLIQEESLFCYGTHLMEHHLTQRLDWTQTFWLLGSRNRGSFYRCLCWADGFCLWPWLFLFENKWQFYVCILVFLPAFIGLLFLLNMSHPESLTWLHAIMQIKLIMLIIILLMCC